MQALLAPLKELAEYDEVRKIVRQGKGTVALSGCVDSQKLHMIYGLSDGLKYKVIVTYNDLKAKVMDDATKTAAEAIRMIITESADAAMNHFNSKKA